MSILKKQGVAWIITVVMIAFAVGFGQAKANRSIVTDPPSYENPDSGFCVYDEAGVLSSGTINQLSRINQQLWDDMEVVIAVVTVNYSSDNLGRDAAAYGDEIGLGGYDFIIMLDISGDNYWLVQGADLVGWFSDQQCSDYAYDCMEKYFARGDYDRAVLALAEELEDWYYDNY